MTGTVWAALAGLGFGVFQSINRRAVLGMDVLLATFLQLVVAAVVLLAAVALSEGLALLWTAPAPAVLNFAVAGFFHFFAGWTLLNASQKRIGAARTSPLIGTTPLFATMLAALALREIPRPVAAVGIVVVVMGVYLVSGDTRPVGAIAGGEDGAGWRASLLGLGAALCWAISPVFTRRGLAVLPAPLVGVTIGMVASVAAYALVLLWRHRSPVSLEALGTKLVAGVLVGLSTWMRWIALSLAPVGVVLAVSLLSVPVVMVLSPFVVGRHLERVTARIALGAALVVAGSSVLVLWG